MNRPWIVLSMALALGCGTIQEVDDDGGGDPGECVEFDATNFTPCDDDELPTESVSITGVATLDTATGTLTVGGDEVEVDSVMLSQSGGPALRIVSVLDLGIESGATLVVTGPAALVLSVHGNFHVDGSIEVSADGGTPGPGGDNPASCDGGGAGLDGGSTGNATDGGGGGGGGGFGGDGGFGGCVGTGGNCAITGGGMFGEAAANTTLTPLRGGCSGGAGGPSGAGAGAGRGAGGGAIQISARNSIRISGSIQASGAGGASGGSPESGGGGAGSGGAILLEAPSVMIESGAEVCANGGSGGEGGSPTQTASPGQRGNCNETAGSTTPPLGSGGDGGTGTSSTMVDGTPGEGSVSGTSAGGGGGGIGVIRMSSSANVESAATVSPMPAFF